ncbi:MAG: NAD(P)/FAD-dependent oxidoreductase [Thermoanaerobaculia bacterium]
MSSEEPYDALVVGGGPGGSSTASLLARHGRRVLLVERQRFPRFHIGESLIPETNRILEALGVLDRIAAAGFPVKRGAVIMAPDGEHERYAHFGEAQGIECPATYEVPRERFDQILLDHAAGCGAQVLQGCRARSAAFFGDGVELRIEDASGKRTVTGRYLVDASGRDGFLARRLGLRQVDPELRQVSVHAWYEGVVPMPPEQAGDARLIALGGHAWAWLIPLDDRVTSVGVVVSRERYAGLPGRPAERLDELVRCVPVLAELLARARRVSPARVDGDYSYATRTYAGERWLLVGDAGSFLDPVFSTGVLLALASGVQAAESVHRCLAAGTPDRRSRRILAAYDREQTRKYRFFRRFVLGYYRPEFRDLLLSPTTRFGLSRAVVTALAGNSRPSFLNRVRLALFFTFVRLQRFVPLVPRRHGGESHVDLNVAGGPETAGAPAES